MNIIIDNYLSKISNNYFLLNKLFQILKVTLLIQLKQQIREIN